MSRRRKNTALARRLAAHWETLVGRPFPGGRTNACIRRTNAGHWQRSAGAWIWTLECVDEGPGICHDVQIGSCWTATEAARPENIDMIDVDGLMRAPESPPR